LCAGCSSGEEPYTLNIYARQAAQRQPGLRWSIDAFDIDVDRLRTARQAVYGGGSLRTTSEEQKAAYFEQAPDERWELRRPLRERVAFAYGNILEPKTFRKAAPYDVLFCRNVLIYFSESAFHRAIANFAQALRLGGLLFLGHSESLIGRSDRFETVRLERCIAYRKVKE
jgi:chemotaxis methyl-accepting protein methylase